MTQNELGIQQVCELDLSLIFHKLVHPFIKTVYYEANSFDELETFIA